ncbi:PKD2-like protein, partial [Mya arenaria]
MVRISQYVCIYFAWTLFVVGTIVPAFFVVLYSIQWGQQKSEEWLTCFLMSMFESIILVDPVMVMMIAFVLACIFRTSRNDTNVDVGVIIENYQKSSGEMEDKVSSCINILRHVREDYTSNAHEYITAVKGGQPGTSCKCLEKRAEFNDRFEGYFAQYVVDIHHLLYCIKTQGDMYNWLNVSVIPSLFPEFDINGSPLHWYDKKFMAGYNTMRLGPPRLRQLRTTNDVKCFEEYSIFKEEEEDFCIGWESRPCDPIENVFNLSSGAWSFNSAVDIWGLPLSGFYTTYGGGGYIAQFDVNRNVSIRIVNELFREFWVDRQTRAVFFEYTLYSPSTNMFIYNVFLIEFPQTGGAFTTYWVYPIRVYSHVGAIGTFTLFCEVIFVIYLFIMLVKLCIRIYQKRKGFFFEFWQVYDLVMFSLGVTSIAIFAIRLGFTYMTINKYKENIKHFVNFSHIVFWDQIFMACLTILVFMATLRLLEVFATSKKVSGLVQVFKECGKDLFWYGMAFFHMFLGFCFLGYLLFGHHLISYMNIFKSLGTLFIAMIGKSKFTEINETQPLLAKIFFTFYILIIIFFVLSIFLSILGASIDNSVQDAKADSNEDLFELLIRKVSTMFTMPCARRKSKGSNDIKNRM